MALGLALHAAHDQNAASTLQRTFERCPVLIGRDDNVASFVLPDSGVSRVHASVDIRDGRICVRDSGSTNGTFAGGQRIASDRWVVVGTLDRPCVIRICAWTLTLSAREVAASAEPADGSSFLTAYAAEPIVVPGPASAAAEPSRAPADWAATRVSAELPMLPPHGASARHTVVTPLFQVTRHYALAIAARNELVTVLGEVFDSAPTQERPQMVTEILRTCPEIAADPVVRSVLERHAGRPLVQTVESASAVSLQELARWYVGGRPLKNASDAFALARKLKAGIDELLTGLVPLFAGLDRFEQQMAIRPNKGPAPTDDVALSSRLPRIPRDAARLLFDWTDTTDSAVRAVRTDLVDLTMHQVAVLNGVMRGVKVLLAELAPGTLDKAFEKKLSQRGFFGRLFGRLGAAKAKLELYRERHSDLADEENERFRVIFGPEFAAEYKQAGEAASSALDTLSKPAFAQATPAPAPYPQAPPNQHQATGPIHPSTAAPSMQNAGAPAFAPRILHGQQHPQPSQHQQHPQPSQHQQSPPGPVPGPGQVQHVRPANAPAGPPYPPYQPKPPNHRN